MVVEMILSLFFSIVSGLIYLVPSFSIPAGMSTAISSVFSLIATVGFFIPLGTLFACMVVMLAVYNIQIIWGLIHWVIRKIPGLS